MRPIFRKEVFFFGSVFFCFSREIILCNNVHNLHYIFTSTQSEEDEEDNMQGKKAINSVEEEKSAEMKRLIIRR